MGVLFLAFFLIFAGGSSSGGGFWHTVEPYLNYPGFEFWKFMNLAIFVGLLVKLLRKPLSEGFKAKREEIRAELIAAENAKNEALAKLTSIEGKLAQLENEKAEILAEASKEAADEKARIGQEAASEAARLKAQAANEVGRKAIQVRRQLRRLSAEESIRLAEEKIKSKLNSDIDAALVKVGIDSIGGAN